MQTPDREIKTREKTVSVKHVSLTGSMQKAARQVKVERGATVLPQ
jgi:hypothetical protein